MNTWSVRTALLLASVSAATLGISSVAHAQDAAQEGNVEVDEGAPASDPNTIVVTGIRQSLSEALNRKRDDPRIIDSIVAEDIGKLPDENIAEALRRLTGVAIDSEFGVGSGVSIRGLSQNRVEVNGRTTLGDTGRQGVNFEDFPSDLVEAIDVIKSPLPKMIEGALGGTVNLRTKRPLALTKPALSARIEGEYNELADDLGYRASGQIGDNWDTDAGRFGVLLNLSWEDRTLRADSTRERLRVREVNGENVVWAEDASIRSRNLDRERFGANLSLQWAPVSDVGNLYFDVAYTDFSQEETSFGFFTSDSGIDVNRPFEVLGDPTNFASPFVNRNVTFRSFSSVSPRKTETWSGAFGGEFDISPMWSVAAEVAYADSNSTRPNQSVQAAFVNPNDLQGGGRAGAPEEIRFNTMFGFNGIGRLPDFVPIPGEFTSDTGSATLSLDDSFVDFLDPSLYVLRNFRDRVTNTNNDEFAARVDVTYENVSDHWPRFITSVDIGGRYTDRSNSFRDFNTNVDNFHRDLLDANGDPVFFDFNALEALGFGFTEVPYTIFPGSNATYITNNWLGFDTDQFSAGGIDATRARFNEFTVGQGLTRRNGTPITIPAFPDIVQSSVTDAQEETLAGYIQANLEADIFGIPMQGVAGARVVRTKVDVDGFGTDENGDIVPRSGDSEYTDVLPSVNLKFAPSDDVLVRFSYGKVLRRPDFSDLSPGLTCSANFSRCDIGNTELEPFRATQYDVSAEWYFAEDALFNVAFFYKDVDAFFQNTILCLNEPNIIGVLDNNRGILSSVGCRLDGTLDPIKVLDDGDATVPFTPLNELGLQSNSVTNGESGTIKGIELGLQTPLGVITSALDGFGIVLNYTLADSEDPNGSPLEDISRHTYNATAYYEKGPFSARAAYTYRTRFLERTGEGRVSLIGEDLGNADDPTRGNSFREPIKQLDLSMSYDITRAVSINLSAVNVTDEKEVFTSALRQQYAIGQTGRRFTFGLRGRF